MRETKKKSARRPLKKWIAIWVVFAMLVVPFANHVSGLDDAKAEGQPGTKTGDVQEIHANLESGSATVNNTDNTISEIQKKESDYTLVKDEQKLLVGKPAFAFQWSETNTKELQTKTYYKYLEADQTPEASYDETGISVNLAEYPEEGLTISESKKLAIYVRALEKTDESTSNFLGTAKLAYVVNVTYVASAFASGEGIYQGETKLSPDDYTANATLRAPLTAEGISGATVKYWVRTIGGGTTDDIKNVSNYASGNTVTATEAYRGNMVYVTAALVSDEGENAKVLEYISLGAVRISNDEKAPTISCTKENVQYFDANAGMYTAIQDNFIDENQVYYGVSSKYKYLVRVTDDQAEGQDATGVKTVTAKLKTAGTLLTVTPSTTASDVYEIELTKEQAQGDTIVVTAADWKGNSKDYNCPIRISQVVEGTAVLGVSFVGEDAWNGLTTGKTLPHQTAKKQIKVTLESNRQIPAVNMSLTNADGKTVQMDADSLTTTKPSVTRVYTVSATFSIPTDLEQTEVFTGMTVKAFDADQNEIDIKGNKTIQTILYDAKAPVISGLKLEKSDDNGNTWKEVGEADAQFDPVITELDTTYRYAVTVADAAGESGIKSVYVDEAHAFTPDGNGRYVWNIPEGELRTDIAYTKTVYASDKAGNVSVGKNLRGVKLIDKALRIDAVAIRDAAGTDVTDQILSGKYTNKQYTLEITASSAYAITNATVWADGYNDGKDGASMTGNTEDPVSHRYTAATTFTLPKQTDVNALLASMYIIVKDKHDSEIRYPEATGTYLGTILYDRTNPILTINEADANTWYANYTVNYEIKSGNTNIESPLAGAGYVITGTSEGKDESIPLDGTQKAATGDIVIPESDNVAGTNLAFTAKDASENVMPSYGYSVKVDKTKPTVDLKVGGKKILSNPLEGDVKITADVWDNLTIRTATITVKGPDTNITKSLCGEIEQVNIKKSSSMVLDTLIGKHAADGDYTVTVKVADKAGNTDEQTVSFRVDNTIPVVTAKISGGETAGKKPGKSFDGTICDYYYRSNVSILLTYEDTNMNSNDVRVTDNNNKVSVSWTRIGESNKYEGSYVVTDSGAHTIRIEAKDQAGNRAVTKQVVFIKDTDAPTISVMINGGLLYSESMGQLDMTADTAVAFSVNELNGDEKDFNYQLIKTVPDQLPVTADVLKTENRVFHYTDEAEYVAKVYAIDLAGNRSADRTVSFRIDKTAPELKISGAASGSSLSSGTTLTFSMTEAFWKDASGTITITRKTGDGASESTYKTIDVKPTGRVTTLTESLSETGEYNVKFTAKDRAGHTSEASNYTVKIDTNKPVITLKGVKNNDKTTKEVEFQAQIDEDFYLSKSVIINATRTYLDEKTHKEKTEDIKFTGYNPTAATTLIRNTFTEDGIYKIQLLCKDAAGNEDSQDVSFTIDKTKPVIDSKVLGAYAGKLTAFAWDYDLNDIVYDLTVCDVHMYLNGTEYDGTSEVEDGAYEMKIVAEDELGNKTEETADFTLDTKAPTFIVTGVEDGEVKNEQYDIQVSLQLGEDILDSVELNGKAITIADNQASITVTEKGDYKLTMKAHDDAGNQAEKTISFRYGQKKAIWLFIVLGVAGVVILGGGIIFAVGHRKKEK